MERAVAKRGIALIDAVRWKRATHRHNFLPREADRSLKGSRAVRHLFSLLGHERGVAGNEHRQKNWQARGPPEGDELRPSGYWKVAPCSECPVRPVRNPSDYPVLSCVS